MPVLGITVPAFPFRKCTLKSCPSLCSSSPGSLSRLPLPQCSQGRALLLYYNIWHLLILIHFYHVWFSHSHLYYDFFSSLGYEAALGRKLAQLKKHVDIIITLSGRWSLYFFYFGIPDTVKGFEVFLCESKDGIYKRWRSSSLLRDMHTKSRWQHMWAFPMCILGRHKQWSLDRGWAFSFRSSKKPFSLSFFFSP